MISCTLHKKNNQFNILRLLQISQMSETKPSMLGAPNPPKTLKPAGKQKSETALNMQASITEPLAVSKPNPRQQKQQSLKTPKKEDNLRPKQARGDASANQVAAGSTIPRQLQHIPPNQANPASSNPVGARNPQQLPETIQQAVSQLFSRDELQKCSDFSKLSQERALELTSMFRLTVHFSEKHKNIEILNTEAERRKIFSKIEYLNAFTDQQTVKQLALCFTTACCKLIENRPYLNNQACVKLFNAYISLDRTKFFKKQAFTVKLTALQNEKLFYQMINGAEQILKHVFQEYQKILLLLIASQSTKQPTKSSIGSRFNTKLIEGILQSFENILSYDIGQRKSKLPSFAFEINLLLNCFNFCFQLDQKYFNKKNTSESILPLLQKAIVAFEQSTTINMQSLQAFLLKLLLSCPFTFKDFKKEKAIQILLKNQSVINQFGYLNLLRDQVPIQSVKPLKNERNVKFLLTYLKINCDFQEYSSQKHAFIIDSICEIFKGRYQYLLQNQSKYKLILRYIDYTIRKISQKSLEMQSESQFTVFRLDYLSTARTAKLLSNLCFTQSQKLLKITTFEEIFIQNTETFQSTQDFNKFLSKGLQIVRIIAYEERSYFQGIQNFFQENLLSTEVIYQLFYKIFLYDAGYFQMKEQQIKSEGFGSLGQFYEALICSFIIKFINKATTYHLNILAFTSLIRLSDYYFTCQKILRTLSSLSNQNITVVDSENNHIMMNAMQLAIEKVLEIKDHFSPNLSAFARLLLVMLEENMSFVGSFWMKGMIARMKKLANIYHPIVLQKYAEALLEVLKYLNAKIDSSIELQDYFDFKFINPYLYNALAFQYGSPSFQPFNKYMGCRRYKEVYLAVQLINSMSKLYIQEKENHLDRIPFEVRRMMEQENRGNDYQLVFTKEACSYALTLAILILSEEFFMDPQLNRNHPTLKDDIYQTLINLKKISNYKHNELNFRVCNIYYKSLEAQINEKINIESTLVENIKKRPTYKSFEFLRCVSNDKVTLNKHMLSKLQNIETDITTVYNQSKFLVTYWKIVSQKPNKTNFLEQWKHISIILNKIRVIIINSDIASNRMHITNTLASIFQLSINIKKANIQLYAKLVLEYQEFFVDYNINCLDQCQQVPFMKQAMTYVLNIKYILPSKLFQHFAQSYVFQQNLKIFVSKCLTIKKQLASKEKVQSPALLFAQLGIVCILDLCQDGQPLVSWLQDISQKMMERVENKEEISVKEVVILMLLSGKLDVRIPAQKITLKGDYWELLTNTLTPHRSVGQILLLNFQSICRNHQVFFISFCHYLVKLAKTSQLSALLAYYHSKLNKNLLEIVKTLLIESINQGKSYYVIWLIQILSEILLNKKIQSHDQIKCYCDIRSFILSQKTVWSRITDLFALLCRKMGVIYSLNSPDYEAGYDKFTTREKLELLAYIRLITFIYFDQKHLAIQNQPQYYMQKGSEKAISQREIDFQVLILNMVPLFTKLLQASHIQMNIETQGQKKISLMMVDQLRASKKTQKNDIWPSNFSVLNLLNEVINYQLVSTSTLWICQTIELSQQKSIIHPSLLKSDQFEEKIISLYHFQNTIIQKMQRFNQFQIIAEEILTSFQLNIYNSIIISREMHFTNSNKLNSYIESGLQQVTYKLTQVAYVIFRLLKQIFDRKKALKNPAAANLYQIDQILKNLSEMIKAILPQPESQATNNPVAAGQVNSQINTTPTIPQANGAFETFNNQLETNGQDIPKKNLQSKLKTAAASVKNAKNANKQPK